MATRQARLAEFITDRLPEPGRTVEVLCEDHVGTYLAPFACRYSDAAWRNDASGELMTAAVLGWRDPAKSRRRARPVED